MAKSGKLDSGGPGFFGRKIANKKKALGDMKGAASQMFLGEQVAKADMLKSIDMLASEENYGMLDSYMAKSDAFDEDEDDGEEEKSGCFKRKPKELTGPDGKIETKKEKIARLQKRQREEVLAKKRVLEYNVRFHFHFGTVGDTTLLELAPENERHDKILARHHEERDLEVRVNPPRWRAFRAISTIM